MGRTVAGGGGGQMLEVEDRCWRRRRTDAEQPACTLGSTATGHEHNLLVGDDNLRGR